MGDATEMHLSGLLCERCGEFLDGKEPGYPRYCDDCKSTTIKELERKFGID